MRCAVFLEKLAQRGDVAPRLYSPRRICAYPEYGLEVTDLYCRSTYADQVFLPAGTYTVDMTAEEGVEKSVRVYTYVDGVAAGQFPLANEEPAEMPFTFTIDSARSVIFTFGVGDWTEDFDWSNFRIHEAGGSAVDVYETRAILPDEIVSGSISDALCAKKAVVIGVSPFSEAFGFAERTITFVRVLDLDLPENRTVFRGRVSALSDVMDTSGRMVQELTCVSALDFLEDTGLVNSEGGTFLQTWLSNTLSMHNTWVEPFRRVNLAYAGTGSERLLDISNIINSSKYSIISKILTDGGYLRRVIGSSAAFTMEFQEHYTDDTSYIDVAKEFSTPKDTAFVIGENLQSIRVERNTDGGIYTAVCAVSGVNSDGSRETYTAYNTEMAARYPKIYTLLIKNDEIRCTAPMYKDGNPTEAYKAMVAALKAYAEQEAANLSVPPIKITLTAADLAAMGFTGYEQFEVGGAHPLVFPKFGYFGQRVRITSLRRQLTDGKIEQITIEQGKVAGKQSSNTLSALIAQLNELNNKTDDSLVEQLEIMDTKIEEQTDGNKIRRMTKAQYDALTAYDDTVLYNVDNSGVNELYIGADHISSGGGGDEPTIETAAVLTSEQMSEWAPEHALVPVDFRGSAHVYYAQPPARIVIQGQRGIFGTVTITTDDPAAELTFDFVQNGQTVRQKLKIYIYSVAYSGGNLSIMLGAACYSITGAAETLVGYGVREQSITIPLPLSSVSIGLLLRVDSLTAQNSDEIVPQCRVQLGYIAGQNQGFWDIPSITGSLFNGSFAVDFGSAAEHGFASGIARRTEPVYPNGGGGE